LRVADRAPAVEPALSGFEATLSGFDPALSGFDPALSGFDPASSGFAGERVERVRGGTERAGPLA